MGNEVQRIFKLNVPAGVCNLCAFMHWLSHLEGQWSIEMDHGIFFRRIMN